MSTAYLTDGELAVLANYDTAPETASPLYQHCDTHAGAAQKRWRRLFRRSLCGLAGISLLSAATDLGTLLLHYHIVQANTLFLLNVTGITLTTIGVGFELLYQRYLRRHLSPWAMARAQAERLRSAVWLYLFDLLPPVAAGATPTADAAWQQVVQSLAMHPRLPMPPAAAEPTAELRQCRQRLHEVGPDERLRAYCVARLDSQYAYFGRRANALHAQARNLRHVITALLVLAFAWNVVRVLAISLNWDVAKLVFNFNGFIVLIGFVGLLKAYLAAEDLEPLAARYEQMQANLAARQQLRPASLVSLAALRQFVTESERVLREENTEWTTKRDDP